jgi:hypothetical protein
LTRSNDLFPEEGPQADKTPVLDSVKMIERGIVKFVFKDDVRITLKNVEGVMEQISGITKSRRVARLCIWGKDQEITNAARLAMAGENKRNKGFIIAEAIVVHSFYQRVKTNLYMHLINRKYPVQCFPDEKSAREWLMWLVKLEKKQ